MKRVLKKNSDSNIFIEEKSNEDKTRDRDTQMFQGVPYLKRGDSARYIEQFLKNEEPLLPLTWIKSEINVLIPPPAPTVVHEQPRE